VTSLGTAEFDNERDVERVGIPTNGDRIPVLRQKVYKPKSVS
jgi:hypothetical protein